MNNFNEQKFQTSQISSEKLQKAIDDLENLDFNIAYFKLYFFYFIFILIFHNFITGFFYNINKWH